MQIWIPYFSRSKVGRNFGRLIGDAGLPCLVLKFGGSGIGHVR